MTAAEVHHPIFARLYARLMSKPDPEADAKRRELLAGLRGRVVEIGAGTGGNFRFYPDTVEEVVAVEPEPYLRARALEAAAEAPARVTVTAGVADALPLEDACADGAVASLVLCSVPSQASALAELRRVLRPGGELRFYEHVAARDPGLARLQRLLDPVWPHCGGGCHLRRDTERAIAEAGFTIERARRFDFRPSPICAPVAPHVLGVARRG